MTNQGLEDSYFIGLIFPVTRGKIPTQSQKYCSRGETREGIASTVSGDERLLQLVTAKRSKAELNYSIAFVFEDKSKVLEAGYIIPDRGTKNGFFLRPSFRGNMPKEFRALSKRGKTK